MLIFFHRILRHPYGSLRGSSEGAKKRRMPPLKPGSVLKPILEEHEPQSLIPKMSRLQLRLTPQTNSRPSQGTRRADLPSWGQIKMLCHKGRTIADAVSITTREPATPETFLLVLISLLPIKVGRILVIIFLLSAQIIRFFC